jgi:hypothetical protein
MCDAAGPDWGLDLSTVNITNLFGRGDRRKAGITHHRGWAGVNDVSRVDDHWITSPARTAAETAALLPLVPAVCVLDWTLNQGMASRAELERYVTEDLHDWPHTANLPVAWRRSHGRSESIGESRSRMMIEDHGIAVVPQWKVLHPSGRLAGRVDLLLPEHGLMVEFDGQVKYGRLLKPGQSVEHVIRDERAREVLLEELTGLRMMRIVWVDLDNPIRSIGRVERAAALRRAG